MNKWSDIPGWEGLYRISTDGEVLSYRRNRFLTPTPGRGGYLRVALSRGSEMTHRTVHSLILLTFVGERPEGYQSCHLDGKRAHNVLHNLAYGTQSENERQKAGHGTSIGGERNPKGKLSYDEVLRIRGAYKLWSHNRSNSRDLAREFGVNRSTIQRIVSRSLWPTPPIDAALTPHKEKICQPE